MRFVHSIYKPTVNTAKQLVSLFSDGCCAYFFHRCFLVNNKQSQNTMFASLSSFAFTQIYTMLTIFSISCTCHLSYFRRKCHILFIFSIICLLLTYQIQPDTCDMIIYIKQIRNCLQLYLHSHI